MIQIEVSNSGSQVFFRIFAPKSLAWKCFAEFMATWDGRNGTPVIRVQL